MKPIDPLTEQERAVLARLAIGQRNAKIADELSISTRTVENHIYHIFHKIGVLSRRQPRSMCCATIWFPTQR
jgi:two-component system, NarL family, response regulator DegU